MSWGRSAAWSPISRKLLAPASTHTTATASTNTSVNRLPRFWRGSATCASTSSRPGTCSPARSVRGAKGEGMRDWHRWPLVQGIWSLANSIAPNQEPSYRIRHSAGNAITDTQTATLPIVADGNRDMIGLDSGLQRQE